MDSARCFFAMTHPGVEACPTDIDIPNFIRMISTGSEGAAEKILAENIFGGMCARVRPTEILCERSRAEHLGGQAGRYRRSAALCRRPADRSRPSALHPRGFERQAHRAWWAAVPPDFSCAHRLAVLGHAVTVYEARAASRRAQRIRHRRSIRRSITSRSVRSISSSRSAASMAKAGQRLGSEPAARRSGPRR